MDESIDNNSSAQHRQLNRFCLYGFLKNLQFFEPFLILAFRARGFSFVQIGFLISFRAVCVNIMEIPSGAIADSWGRRRSMILSMCGYIASFALFGFADVYGMFFPAMFLFALGEAFRTGTHKAMIFDWLERNDRRTEKTRIYGLTRSWSKLGSALNSIVAAVIVIFFRDYQWVFLLAIIPYALNVANLMLYPRYLDCEPKETAHGLQMLKDGFGLLFSRKRLRGLIMENICFEGVFSVLKDYLQPTLKTAAIALPVLLVASGQVRTAVLVAIVYCVLNLISGWASRVSHSVADRAGSDRQLGRNVLVTAALLYAAMLAGFFLEMPAVPVICFVILFVLFNIWKPVFVSRFHDESELASAATTLSIANQSKSLSVAVLAPLLGFAVDRASAGDGLCAFWPVAAAGVVFSAVGIAINARGNRV